jgi:hypothetical protein
LNDLRVPAQERPTILLSFHLAETIFARANLRWFKFGVARKPEEIKALLEVGFEFVCRKGELLYFRKRK